MNSLPRHFPGHVTMKTKLLRALWMFVYALFFRFTPIPFFRVWRIALLRLFGGNVAWSATVYPSVSIWAPWNLQMGHRACLGPHVICYNQDKVILNDNTIVSQYAYLCTASHDTSLLNTADKSLVTSPILIQDYAWVAARAFIGPGVAIGSYAIVGATASVFKDVPHHAIVGGNPARVIKVRQLNNADVSGETVRELPIQ